MRNTIIRTIFVVFKRDRYMEKVKLTEKELDLIMSIRNYGKSFPNGYPEIRWEIERMFFELLDEAEEKK